MTTRINPRCVVPTLVIDGKITTDAYNICRLVDARFGKSTLVPKAPDGQVGAERFSKRAKAIFVEALSYGDAPDYTRPLVLRLFGRKNHSAKASILTALIAEHKDDPFLKDAYARKLKILEFTEDALNSPQEMQALMRTIYDSMDKLDAQVGEGTVSNRRLALQSAIFAS